jgi:hypothetical protein
MGMDVSAIHRNHRFLPARTREGRGTRWKPGEQPVGDGRRAPALLDPRQIEMLAAGSAIDWPGVASSPTSSAFPNGGSRAGECVCRTWRRRHAGDDIRFLIQRLA